MIFYCLQTTVGAASCGAVLAARPAFGTPAARRPHRLRSHPAPCRGLCSCPVQGPDTCPGLGPALLSAAAKARRGLHELLSPPAPGRFRSPGGEQRAAVRRIIHRRVPSVRGGLDFWPPIDLQREINDVCLTLPPHAAAELLWMSRCSSQALAGLRRLISRPRGHPALFISCAGAPHVPRSSGPSGEPRQAQRPGTEWASPRRTPPKMPGAQQPLSQGLGQDAFCRALPILLAPPRRGSCGCRI